MLRVRLRVQGTCCNLHAVPSVWIWSTLRVYKCVQRTLWACSGCLLVSNHLSQNSRYRRNRAYILAGLNTEAGTRQDLEKV